MTLLDVAAYLDYEIIGCANEEVFGIEYARNARENDIGVAFSKKEIMLAKSKVVLTDRIAMNTNKTLLVSFESVETALVKVATLFIKMGYYSDYTMTQKIQATRGGYGCGLNCIIGKNTQIGMFSVIEDDVVIGDDCIIASNTVIKSGTRLGNKVRVGSGSVIGADSFYHYYDNGIKTFTGVGKVKIGNEAEIGNHVMIQRGTLSETKIGDNTKIGNLIDIGHDVEIGCNCKIVSQTGIAGNAVIGDFVTIYGNAGIANNVIVGDYATIMAKSAVTKNVGNGMRVSGFYAREHTKELRMQAKINRL